MNRINRVNLWPNKRFKSGPRRRGGASSAMLCQRGRLTDSLAQTKRSKHKTQIGRFSLLKTSRERHFLDLAGKAS